MEYFLNRVGIGMDINNRSGNIVFDTGILSEIQSLDASFFI